MKNRKKKAILPDTNETGENRFVSRFSCTVGQDIPPVLRLDRYIAETVKVLSRSQIKARSLMARINGKEVKISKLIRGGDRLELCWEDAQSEALIPEDLPLDIIYEDGRVAVINKAQGMVVHPGAGNSRGTLANALCYRAVKKQGSSESRGSFGLRPGIVHRLDKDTSGLIITAWDEEAHAFLAGQFKKRKVIKTYAAIVQGSPEQSGRIKTLISRSRRNRKLFAVSHERGKPSLTYYKLVQSWGSHSLVLLRPKTGRTHQLRVHLRHLGHPILGDPLYGMADSRFPRSSLMLHAKRLSIALPAARQRSDFRTCFPPRFYEILSMLRKRK
ncbi:MAG: RluA family pseudouridine synthase [Treponema sp.]|nr:RluA family pseudouridine synthase [Treponema sp.]